MKTALKILGVLGIVIVVLLMGLFFRLRRNNQTLQQFIEARSRARIEAQATELQSTTLVTGMNAIKLTVDGEVRTSLLFIPQSYDPNVAMPLVIGYHGGFGQGKNQEKLTHMSQIAEKEGFLVAYPDGISRHWNDGRLGHPEITGTYDDVAFTRELIAQLTEKVTVDRARIYATGISNGGMMTYRLACEMTDVFAAVAPVSSGFPKELEPSCKPSGPIPILIIQSTDDPLIPFAGGQIQGDRGEVFPTVDALQWWIRNNGAPTTPTTTELPDTDTSDGTRSTREVYGSGISEVQFIKVEGAGHTWPGGNQYARESAIGKTARDFDASQVIWDFFKTHTR